MPPPERPNDVLKQIEAAWSKAQDDLAKLRAQVDHAAALAQAKVAQNVLERDLERAYRELGEAVWGEVSKGRLALPPSLARVAKAMEQVSARIAEQNASVNDLLAEGAEAVSRLKTKMPSKGVAPGTKKR